MHLEQIFKLKLEVPSKTGNATDATSAPSDSSSAPIPLRELPVVIIGMRASGKSSMAAAVASSLGWEYLDMDRVLAASVRGGTRTLTKERESVFVCM